MVRCQIARWAIWSIGAKRLSVLLDDNGCSTNCFAGEAADFAGFEGDDAVTFGVDGVVAAEFGAAAWTLAHANLADNDLADTDFFACEQFNAEPLPGTILSIFGGTAGFYV